MTALPPSWPLEPVELQLLDELAALVEQAGAWRFLCAPVVAATTSDFPEPWRDDAASVGALIARMLWHAHLTIPITVEELRLPRPAHRAPNPTTLELVELDDRGARFATTEIGRDHADAVGATSHEVGRTFVAAIAREGAPFRAADPDLPTPRAGSIAAVYLGLGVIAANAAYDWNYTEGRRKSGARQVADVGGLALPDLAFLLAVQAAVRDDTLAALGTLQPSQAKMVAAWRAPLAPHAAELRALLRIGAVGEAPPRPATPAAATLTGAFAKRAPGQINAGRRVFRLRGAPQRSGTLRGATTGVLVGGITALVLHAAPYLLLAIPSFALGKLASASAMPFRCGSCRARLLATDTACGACGGTIVGEVADDAERLEREEELEAAERAGRDPG